MMVGSLLEKNDRILLLLRDQTLKRIIIRDRKRLTYLAVMLVMDAALLSTVAHLTRCGAISDPVGYVPMALIVTYKDRKSVV